MRFLRRLAFAACALLLALSVTIIIAVGTLQKTLLDRGVVKHWVSRSGIYDNALNDTVLSEPANLMATLNGNELLNATVIRQTLQATFPPDYLKQKGDGVIDEVYDWLYQKVPQLVVSINASDRQAIFTQAVRDPIAAKLASLKLCPATEMPTLEDATTGRCMPRGTTPADLAQQIADEVTRQSDLFGHDLTVHNPLDLNSAKLKTDATPTPAGIPPVHPLANLPTTIWWLRLAFIAAWPVAVLGSLGLLFLAVSKRRGVRAIAWRLFLGGIGPLLLGIVLIVFGPYVSLVNLAKVSGQAGVGASSSSVALVEPLLHVAAADIGYALTIFSGIFVGAALILLIGLLIFRPRAPKTDSFLHDETDLGKWLQDSPGSHDPNKTIFS